MIDWTSYSPKEIFEASKTMPKVAGPWEETERDHLGTCWERAVFSVDFQCFRDHYRIFRGISGEYKAQPKMDLAPSYIYGWSLEEVKEQVDQSLRSKGWLLV